MTKRLRHLRVEEIGQDEPYPHDQIWRAGFKEEPAINSLEALALYAPPIRAFFSTAMVDGEVGNGGWEQLFYNDMEEWLEPALDGWEYYDSEPHMALIRDVRTAAASGADVRAAARAAGTWDAFAETYELASLDKYNRRWQGIALAGESLRLADVRRHPYRYIDNALSR